MKTMKQSGMTVIELIIAIFGLCMLIGAGFGVYAAIHFILKFW